MTNTLNTAFLSNNGEYTFFKFRDRVITFFTGKRLEKYTKILEWNCTCQQKLDTKLKKSGIKNESMYKIHQLF